MRQPSPEMIKAVRLLLKGLTVQQAADAVGISKQAIYKSKYYQQSVACAVRGV